MLRRVVAVLLLLCGQAFADAYSTLILADSPTHYHTLDDSSGTTAVDSAGGGDGTYNGGFTLSATGIVGRPSKTAVTFNGSTGYVALTSSVNFVNTTLNGGFTAEVWVYKTADTTGELAAQATDPTAYNWRLAAVSSAGCGQADGCLSYTVWQCAGATYGATGVQGHMAQNTWYHVVATALGAGSNTLTNMKLYLNASLLTTVTSFSGTVCGTAGVLNAARFPTSANYLTGKLDELALYTNSTSVGQLSAAQVSAHYAAGISVPGGSFPWIVRAPQMPRFVDDGYFKKVVRGGYHDGHFASTVLEPSWLTVGYLPFNVMPDGRANRFH